MSKFLTNPPVQRPIPGEADYVNGAPPWVLRGELRYQSDLLGEILVVPEGFRTDFASTPWLFRRLFPQDGPYTQAAVAHDWLCVMRPPGIDSKKAAKLFHEAMCVLAVPKGRREAMYRAVLWFGPKWDN